MYRMKVSRNDPFDLNLSIRGLGVMMTYVHSDLYEYMYYLTFKRAMKSHVKDFKDAWDQHIEDLEFFRDTNDIFVLNCFSAAFRIIAAKQELVVRWGIYEQEDLLTREIISESYRFLPGILIFKRSKSYKKLTAYYERALSECIEAFYFYACIFTASSNKIPLVLKRQFKQPGAASLRLLNHDDHNVQLLSDLITGLTKDLEELKALRAKKYKDRGNDLSDLSPIIPKSTT